MHTAPPDALPPQRPGASRTLPLRTALLALLLAAIGFLPSSARADFIDLSESGRHSVRRPPTLVLRAEGGSDYSPYGLVGGCLSYFNDFTLVELEGGAGAGFPGLQLGFAVRKLFGEGGDFFVTELSIAGNTKQARGENPVTRLGGHTTWTNLGVGFEHREGFLSFGLTGGLTVLSFSESPSAFIRGGLGIGF